MKNQKHFPQLPKLSADEVAETLSYIPAYPDYETWIKILCGVCSEIGETQGANVLENWSPENANGGYPAKITSFHGSYETSIATVIELAKEYGFDASAFTKARAEKFCDKKPARSVSANSRDETPAQEVVPADTGNEAQGNDSEHGQDKGADFDAKRPVKLGECSICERANKPDVRPCSLLDELRKFKTDYKAQCDEIRAISDKKLRNAKKLELLSLLCVFGVYQTKRADGNLLSRSGFIIADYDKSKKNTPEVLRHIKTHAPRLPFVLAVFDSPSGGLKVIVRVLDNKTDKENLELMQCALAPLGGELDPQVSARKHCYVSHDPEAYITKTPLEEIPPLRDPEEMDWREIAVLYDDLISDCAYHETDYYFCKRGRWSKFSKGDVSAEFKMRGAGKNARWNALYAIRELRAVEAVYDGFSCYPIGITEMEEGKRALLRREPKIITPAVGKFPTIQNMLLTVFGGDWAQLNHFLLWEYVALGAFLKCCASGGKDISPVPMLAILGNAGAGKDLLFGTLINALLGGRPHAGMESFGNERPFLGCLLGHECILGTEGCAKSDKEREKLKATIKSILGGSGYFAELKGKDPFTARLQHFIVMLANSDDGGNCARAIPVADADFEDKMVALNITNADAVKRAFPSAHRAENEKRIRAELPAFADWLLNKFPALIPVDWKDDRFGMKGWQSKGAKDALLEVSTEYQLHEYLQGMVDSLENKKFAPAELVKRINDEYYTAYKVSSWGRLMRKLCATFPHLYEYNGDRGNPRYTLTRGTEQPPVINTDSEPETNGNFNPFDGMED